MVRLLATNQNGMRRSRIPHPSAATAPPIRVIETIQRANPVDPPKASTYLTCTLKFRRSRAEKDGMKGAIADQADRGGVDSDWSLVTLGSALRSSWCNHVREQHKVVVATTIAFLASVALVIPASAAAKNCGKIAGANIVTHGDVSCKTAGGIYMKFKAGRRLPHGWVCGLSAGACSKGRQGFTFRFNP